MHISSVSAAISSIATKAASNAQQQEAVVTLTTKASWIALTADNDVEATASSDKAITQSDSKVVPLVVSASPAEMNSSSAVQSILSMLQNAG